MRYVYYMFPLLILITLAEYALSRKRGPGSHGLVDSLGNVGCGIFEQSVGKLIYPVVFLCYREVYDSAALFAIPADAAWAWVAGFLLSDLAFYVFHRALHGVNAMWATHMVHHQSSYFNFTVAMRNGAFQRLFGMWFYLPLALIGVPGDMLLVLLSLSILYQFVLHTRLVGKLGPLEWVLNTPSHHRVHHATEPGYVDRNFGAILIVWDRLFGTFAAEGDEPVYGLSNPALRTSNPLLANVQYWVWLVRVWQRGTRGLVRVLAGSPARDMCIEAGGLATPDRLSG